MSLPSSSGNGYVTARVLESIRLSPSFIRVEFLAEGPGAISSSGVPDEIVHLYFPEDGEESPPQMTVKDGVLAHHEPEAARESRNYTVRRWVDDRITIDFVDHGDGLAASWARNARPGQLLGMWGTRAWYSPPADTDWTLLVADLPGIPALLRTLEELPSSADVHAIAEIADPADALDHSGPAAASIDWRVGGNGRAASRLVDAVAAYEPPAGNGYVWFAGEASIGRALRKHFRNELGLPAHRLAIIGYWRDDKDGWLRRYEPQSEALLADYERAAASARTEAEAEIYWDEILERAGL